MKRLKITLSSFLGVVIVSTMLQSCSGSESLVHPPVDFASLQIERMEVLSATPDFAYDPKVTVNPVTGEIFCCYVKKIQDVPEVHWRHGQPGNFGNEEVITIIDGWRSFNPALKAGSDGRVYFAYMNRIDTGWFQKEIFTRTWDSGQWSDELMLSDPSDWTSWDPDIAVFDDGRPMVCWFDHGFGVQHEILVKTEDGEGNWSAWTRLTNDDHWQYYPQIDIDGNDVMHLVYADTREIEDEWFDPDHYREGTNLEIYYRNWDGAEIGEEVRITNSQFRSRAPHVAVEDNGKVHIIYLDETETGHYRLYYRNVFANEPGISTAISGAGSRCDQSDVGEVGGRVFIVWPEYSDPGAPATGNTTIYLTEILSNGQTNTPLVLASGSTNLHPRLAVDEERSMLWVIWMEYHGDDETIKTGESNIRLFGIKVN